MLKIENTYDDRDVTITVRAVNTGADGTPVELAAGKIATVEVDGEHQVSLSTRGRYPDEPALSQIPAATVLDDEDDAGAGDDGLEEASDAEVTAVIGNMVASNTDLTQAGKPELVALNKRLNDAGYSSISGARRDALMPAA